MSEEQPPTQPPVIQGFNDVVDQGTSRSWNATEGESTTREFKGPLDKINDKFNELKFSEGIRQLDLQPAGGKPVGTLTVESFDRAGEIVEGENALWEIDTNELFIDLRLHPYFTTVSGSFATDIAQADRAIEDKRTFFAPSDAFFPSEAGRYYEMRMTGIEGFFKSVLVLRITQTVSSESVIESRYKDVNTVVDLSEINPPRKLLGALSLLPIITGYVDADKPDEPTIVNGDWEWLKKTPRVTSIQGGNKFQLTQEWWGADAWSAVLYGGTFDPKQ